MGRISIPSKIGCFRVTCCQLSVVSFQLSVRIVYLATIHYLRITFPFAWFSELRLVRFDRFDNRSLPFDKLRDRRLLS